LKLFLSIVLIICLSSVDLTNVAVPFSHLVSGLTTNNTTSRQEICGDGLDNDENGLVDERCPVNSSSIGIPATNFNKSKILRLAVVGDIDANQGLTKQLEIANH